MAGISSKAALGLENRKKYNGIEFDQDLGLDSYEAFFRNLDPQTGRWWQIDPETENMEMWSPYASNYNNPILYKDPRGSEGEACCGGILKLGEDAVEIYRAVRGGENILDAVKSNDITWKSVINVIGEAISFDRGGLIIINPKDFPINKDLKPVVLILPPDTKVPNQVQAKAKKGPKDLVGDAKAAQQKQAEAKANAAKRSAQTARGNSRTGKSNKDLKGEHDSGDRDRQTHTKANARRAADQKVKGPDNTY